MGTSNRGVKNKGGGTLTTSQYFNVIRSALREGYRLRYPIAKIVRDKAKRPSQSDNKRLKWEYQCNICSGWFSGKDTQVDHIIPCGELQCYDDLPRFVATLYCEEDNLQVICTTCHDKKTKEERDAARSKSG